MSHMQFKGKVTLKKFEGKLLEVCGESREPSKRTMVEDGKRLTLYYIDGGHAGTWMKGEGWIFTDTAIYDNIESTKAAQAWAES